MELRDQLGKYFDSPDGKALLVTDVKKNSNAHKAGIEAGDVITKVGETFIEEMSDLHDALKDAKAGTTVDVDIIRKGARKSIKLEVSAHEKKMMMNFGEGFPHMQNFKFENFPFDHEQMRDMLKDLKPQLEKMKKNIRIQINGECGEKPCVIEEETESGTEL